MTTTVEPTRLDIEEALGHLATRAHREPHIVGHPDHPTRWDRVHAVIDQRLAEWEALG